MTFNRVEAILDGEPLWDWKFKYRPLIGAGFKSGLLTVVEVEPIETGASRYTLCRCECGKLCRVRYSLVKSGKTSSCGCRRRKRGGQSHSPGYKLWYAMISKYGKKAFCKEWREFPAFVEFVEKMGVGPDGYVRGRLDPVKPYAPNNYGWVIPNTSGAEKLSLEGRTRTLAEWARQLGISSESLRRRLKSGWPLELALTVRATSKSSPRLLTFRGRTQPLGAWAREIGVSHSTLRFRLKMHWPLEKALTARPQPVHHPLSAQSRLDG